MKNKKKKIRRDEKGEYILRQYFVGGKMKHETSMIKIIINHTR